ncbi:DUF402 domain-containing protein [Nakamurella sp. YIM 132087]|uniref:DUF402 domain-containing protein n=2 Tax=Nakamurella alba TaxID=2665158 RepID=A0A7K1FSU7_9ACTN|nr:DUF402 domain-containing protein [Nakamurella alba]
MIPLRVVADDGSSLLGWNPPGTPMITGAAADGRGLREVPLAQRFAVPRRRTRDIWRGTSTLRLIEEGVPSSVWWFWDADSEFLGWYVNLEEPHGRTATTVDRADGILDVLVLPDRTAQWKDEDEAAAAVAVGRLDGPQLAALRLEGRRRIEQAQRNEFPFDGSHLDFRPDPDWPLPQLPTDVELGGELPA